MSVRAFVAMVLFASQCGGPHGSAHASDFDGTLCLSAAERTDNGEALSPAEKEEAHGACRRAIKATGSIVQKYQFDEADFAITGRRYNY